jgi:ribosomal subunit interface protein
MSNQTQITLRNIDRSEAMETKVRRSVAKLERLHAGLLRCHVVVESPHQHKHQGRQFVVRLDIKVPDSEIIVNRDHDADPYVALREAFDAAARQLGEYSRKRRGEVKRHSAAGAGTGADE